MAIQKNILVYADWKGLGGPILMRLLHAVTIRGKEVFSFEYSADWLKSGVSQMVDPDLLLYSGMQFLPEEKRNFGIFLDSSPDRWGETLMRRRENIFARNEKRKPKTLLASDYLLGVFDDHRMGALRFKENESGPFINDNISMATPPWTLLRALENASL